MIGNVTSSGLTFKGYSNNSTDKKYINSEKNALNIQNKTKSSNSDSNIDLRKNLKKVDRHIRMIEGICRRKGELDSSEDISFYLKQLKEMYNYKFELERQLSAVAEKSVNIYTPASKV